MKPKVLVIELHYLPCIQYFVYLSSFEKIVIDLNDGYVKQTYRNRCRINGANKIENLIVPVKKISNKKMLSCDVLIDHQQKWMNKHLRAIKSAYGKAPFFEYYSDELLDIYNKKPKRLLDLNKELLTKCLEFLNINLNIIYSKSLSRSDITGIYNAKNEVNPKKPVKNNHLFSPATYFQVFGNNFVGNLSVIDLIFCEGPQAKQILSKSSALE